MLRYLKTKSSYILCLLCELFSFRRASAEHYYFSNGEKPERLRTVSDVASKVLKDELVLFLNWERVFDLTVPSTPLKKKHRKVDITMFVNGTRVPYKRCFSFSLPSPGSENESQKQCAICYEELGKSSVARQLPCRHQFHDQCIRRWIFREEDRDGDFYEALANAISRYTCPCCRMNVFDWFFFSHYKPSFVKHCETAIADEDKARIERDWERG